MHARSNTGFRRLIFVLGAVAASVGCVTSPLPTNPVQSTSIYADDVFRLSAEADSAYRESRWIDAARDYQRLTERVPRDAYAWFRLGNTYAQQGAYDRAIHAYETSLQHDSEQPKPWFNLSTAYLLRAQLAMTAAHGQLRPGDPARKIIEHRLTELSMLVHGRFEDDLSTTPLR